MPDRLAELQRQRALLQEHLAWLEREIAAETGKSREGSDSAPATPSATPSPPLKSLASAPPGTPRPTVAPQPSFASATAPLATGAGDAHADALLEKYRVGTDSLRTDIRKGCFLYFAAAVALLVLGVAILYWTLTRR